MTMTQAFERAPAQPCETSHVHTRLLKCTLCLDESRAYWPHRRSLAEPPSSEDAFTHAWFGARSQPWVDVILANMRARFDAFPAALFVLSRWRTMSPDTRRLICHFHVQLSDPLYRRFTGEYLPGRHLGLRGQVQRHAVMRWVAEQMPGRWTVATQTQFASRLLSSALSAGLIKGRRDPRQVLFPRVSDDALVYLLYLLRGVRFEGTLHSNPYLASIGLDADALGERLRAVSGVRHRRAGALHDFEWQYPDLQRWAQATVLKELD